MSETVNTTAILIVDWFNAYGIIPTVIGIIIIIGFFLKLGNDLCNLRDELDRFSKQFDNHPLIALFRTWEQHEGAIDFLNIMLKNKEVAKKNDD
jgi:hypothetical protein